jgi:hypothetical protein
VQLKVNKAQLSVTANNLNMVYGAAIPRLTFIISGFVHGDTLNSSVTGAPGITTSATSKSAVGTYLVISMAGTLSAANYSFTFKPGTLTVTKAVLTATATSVSATYNKPLPKLAYTVAGYLNGDTLSSVRGAPIETTTAKQGSLPGTYPITIAQGTLAATNYGFLFKGGTLTVTPLGKTATPVIKPAGGTYTSTQTVTISDATPGAVVYYTTNGTTPTTSSTKYTGAIKVSATETLEAIAVATGYSNSAVASATYTIATAPAVTSKAETAITATGATLNGGLTANNATTHY